jgi:hypothetical protein
MRALPRRRRPAADANKSRAARLAHLNQTSMLSAAYDLSIGCVKWMAMSNRRQFERFAWGLPGTIEIPDGTLVECQISNTSTMGACLYFSSTEEIPETFIVHLGPSTSLARRCHVVWRKDNEIGVKFDTGLPSGEPERHSRRRARTIREWFGWISRTDPHRLVMARASARRGSTLRRMQGRRRTTLRATFQKRRAEESCMTRRGRAFCR